MSITEKLAEIQQALHAPKSQYNNFGKYSYRNCEDILEAVKPLLGEYYTLISDEVVMVGERYYVKATAALCFDQEMIIATAFAREATDKKGMDAAQITGAASSYARKYALNGLFCIDDTKDADSKDNTQTQAKSPQGYEKSQHFDDAPRDDDKPWYNSFDDDCAAMRGKVNDGSDPQHIVNHLLKTFKMSKVAKQQILDLGK